MPYPICSHVETGDLDITQSLLYRVISSVGHPNAPLTTVNSMHAEKQMDKERQRRRREAISERQLGVKQCKQYRISPTPSNDRGCFCVWVCSGKADTLRCPREMLFTRRPIAQCQTPVPINRHAVPHRGRLQLNTFVPNKVAASVCLGGKAPIRSSVGRSGQVCLRIFFVRRPIFQHGTFFFHQCLMPACTRFWLNIHYW